MNARIEMPDQDIPLRDLTPATRRKVRECMESLTSLPGLKRHGPTITAALEHLARSAYTDGIDYALASEEKAWKRATDVEDVLIELMRYVPGSTLVKARALASDIKQTLEDTEPAHG